jgi:hypothetical protein
MACLHEAGVGILQVCATTLGLGGCWSGSSRHLKFVLGHLRSGALLAHIRQASLDHGADELIDDLGRGQGRLLAGALVGGGNLDDVSAYPRRRAERG